MGKSGSVSYGVTTPFSWALVHTKFWFLPSMRLFPKPCVSSGSFAVELMATPAKRAYATSRSTAPRVPAHSAVHCWPVSPQETFKYSSVSVSVGSLGPGVHKVCLSPLSVCGRYEVSLQTWFHPSYHLASASPLPLDVGISSMSLWSHTATAPVFTLLLGLLYPWAQDISSQSLQCYMTTIPSRAKTVVLMSGLSSP